MLGLKASKAWTTNKHGAHKPWAAEDHNAAAVLPLPPSLHPFSVPASPGCAVVLALRLMLPTPRARCGRWPVGLCSSTGWAGRQHSPAATWLVLRVLVLLSTTHHNTQMTTGSVRCISDTSSSSSSSSVFKAHCMRHTRLTALCISSVMVMQEGAQQPCSSSTQRAVLSFQAPVLMHNHLHHPGCT